MTEKLTNQIKAFNPDVDVNSISLEQYFYSKHLDKGETLLAFHSVCRYYYFVNTGALRIFFLNGAEEYTSWFAFENYFFTELDSYTNASLSNFCITAIEQTEILQISKPNMNKLLAEYDWWKNFLLCNQQQIIIKLTEHIQSFQAESAGQRYEKLFGHPEFIQRTKQKDLSSMLGITRYSLSRLRKKKSGE